MKKLLFILAVVAMCAGACTKKVMVKGTPPPGQMKKLTGSKSAKPFAPGQQKKAATKSSSPSKSAPGQKKKN